MRDYHPIPIGGILLALGLALAALIAFNVCGCGGESSPDVLTAVADGGAWAVRCRQTDGGINATLYRDDWLEVRDGGHRLHAGVAVTDYVTRTAFIPGGAVQYLSLLRWDEQGGGTLTFGNGTTVVMDCKVGAL